MKKFYFLVLIIFINVLAHSQTHVECSRTKSFLSNQERSATLSTDYIALTEEYDVHFYFLDLNVENTSVDVSGTVEIHATSKVPLLDTFMVELHTNHSISDIRVDGVSSSFSRAGTAVIVPVNFSQGDQFIVSIDYSGTAPFGWGMRNATAFGNGVTWTLSESFSAYEWWPCKQSLTDKADSVYVFLTTDQSNLAGSNGVLTNVVDLGNGMNRYEWKSKYPIDYYLISIAVSNYDEYVIYANPTAAPNPIPIVNYVYSGMLSNYQSNIDMTADFIEYFSDIYGLYPFYEEKYGHCMAPMGGGMEHQTMTTQSAFYDELTVHELGHQWFGDNVTCASWTDIWLNEGFASYTEELMLEHFSPGDEVQYMQDRHDNIMSQPGGSVYVSDSLNENVIFSGRLTYDKGAAILHTFRYIMKNDLVFFEVLRTYQTTFADSTAHVSDFKAIAENISGLDLTPFFDEWFYGEGFPTYNIEWDIFEDVLYLHLTQTTSATTPLFTTELELKITDSDGNFLQQRFPVTSNDEIFSIPWTSGITSIEIDPDNWIINEDGTITENDGLAELYHDSIKFYVYPNPNNGSFVVDCSSQSEMRVYSVDGKLIQTLQLQIGKNDIQLDLAPGMYYLQNDFMVKTLIVN